MKKLFLAVIILATILILSCSKEKLDDPTNVHQTMWWTNNKSYDVDLWVDKSASVMILQAGKTSKWDASNNNVYCIGRTYEIKHDDTIVQSGIVQEINVIN